MYYCYTHIRTDTNKIISTGIDKYDETKVLTYKQKYVNAFKYYKEYKTFIDSSNLIYIDMKIVLESSNIDEVKLLRDSLYKEYRGKHYKGCSGVCHPASKQVFVYNEDGSFVKSYGSYNTCHKELGIDLGYMYKNIYNTKEYSYTFNGYVVFDEYKGSHTTIKTYPQFLKEKNFGKKNKIRIYNDTESYDFQFILEALVFLNCNNSKHNYKLIAKAIKSGGLFQGYYWKRLK